jgi:uncharacterized protein (TIGR03067 family)
MTRRLASCAVTVVAVGLLAFAHTEQQPPAPAPPRADNLDGTWELVSVIDDGRLIPLDIVRETMIRDARVVISGAVAAITRPDGQVHTLAFVTDAAASPRTIDLAGATTLGTRGIYLRDGDTLVLSMSGSDTATRPAQFVSLPGSDGFLLTLRRVPDAPPPAAPPQPPPAPAALPDEAALRRMLVGTWGHQTRDEVVRVTLNADGTFSILTTHQRVMRRVFNREDRTSGTWRLRDDVVTLTTTASPTRREVGQVQSFRVTSVSESEVIYVDNQTGQRRIQWRLR